MNLQNWAIRHGVSADALAELEWSLKYPVHTQANDGEGSEAGVSQRTRLEAPHNGGILWRNNVGAYSENNPPSPGTRWGLCNDSKRVNEQIKSSDLIGVTTIEHAGRKFGVFTAIETKAPQWVYKGREREEAQLKYINIVRSFGGIGGFATRAEDYGHLITGYCDGL